MLSGRSQENTSCENNYKTLYAESEDTLMSELWPQTQRPMRREMSARSYAQLQCVPPLYYSLLSLIHGTSHTSITPSFFPMSLNLTFGSLVTNILFFLEVFYKNCISNTQKSFFSLLHFFAHRSVGVNSYPPPLFVSFLSPWVASFSPPYMTMLT